MQVLLWQAVPAPDGHIKSSAEDKGRNGGIVESAEQEGGPGVL